MACKTALRVVTLFRSGGAFLFLTLALGVGSGQARADVLVNAIDIQGIQRIEPSTVVSYLGIREGDSVSAYDIDAGMKALYDSGFFADVSVTSDANSTLLVKVVENPTINQIAFEGNDALDDEDLEKELQLKPRSVYTRPAVQSDLARILSLYRRKGRYSAQVDPKVITRGQNRVDLVYEISEGPVSRIIDIRFIGNKNYSGSTLKDVVKSTEECWYCFLSDNDKYDPDRVQYDRELLRKFYTSQGFADFKVLSSIAELAPDKDGFFVTYTVEEGPKYDFGEVTFDTKLVGADTGKLKDKITTAKGDTYNSEEVENSTDAIINELGNEGFAFVDIDPRLRRDEANKVVDLEYKVNEGPRVYVERINITGNIRTLDEVVRREFRLAEGDAFNTDKLQRSEQRLRNLGFFEKVEVTQAQGSSPDKVVINVAVSEASTGELSLGAGYSTVDGALTDVGLREKNLLGRGQDLRFKTLLATQRQQYDIGFTEPYFMGRELAAGFDIFKITQDLRTESSFDRDSLGGRLRLGYGLTEHLDQQLRYSYETVDITNIDALASRFVRDQEGTNTTSLVGHTLTYDRRDNVFDPTSGYFLRLSQDVAGLGGDSRFFRNEGDAAYFYSFLPEWTTMLSASAGHVQQIGRDIRINDRFFIGGKSLRGFDNAGIGPRDITTDDALGGNTYYTLTAEQKFPIGLPNDLGFQGAVFMDAGTLFGVDDTGPEVVDEASIRASIGVGVAWKSPFGPIRIDIAKPIIKEEFDSEELVQFNFGTRF